MHTPICRSARLLIISSLPPLLTAEISFKTGGVLRRKSSYYSAGEKHIYLLFPPLALLIAGISFKKQEGFPVEKGATRREENIFGKHERKITLLC